jgi:ADP-ribose pyrophosphatase YjhB (NUDIX family)
MDKPSESKTCKVENISFNSKEIDNTEQKQYLFSHFSSSTFVKCYDDRFNNFIIDLGKAYVFDIKHIAYFMVKFRRELQKYNSVIVHLGMLRDLSESMQLLEGMGFEKHAWLMEENIFKYVLWMGEGKSIIPPYMTGKSGVAIILTSDQDSDLEDPEQLYLVQERYGPTVGKWKLPTGTVEPGEFPHAAVYREVEEELFGGRDIEFINLRYIASYYQASKPFDVCYLFSMELKNPVDGKTIEAQKSEIVDVKSIDIEDFNSDDITSFTKECVECFVEITSTSDRRIIHIINRGSHKLARYV